MIEFQPSNSVIQPEIEMSNRQSPSENRSKMSPKVEILQSSSEHMSKMSPKMEMVQSPSELVSKMSPKVDMSQSQKSQKSNGSKVSNKSHRSHLSKISKQSSQYNPQDIVHADILNDASKRVYTSNEPHNTASFVIFDTFQDVDAKSNLSYFSISGRPCNDVERPLGSQISGYSSHHSRHSNNQGSNIDNNSHHTPSSHLINNPLSHRQAQNTSPIHLKTVKSSEKSDETPEKLTPVNPKVKKSRMDSSSNMLDDIFDSKFLANLKEETKSMHNLNTPIPICEDFEVGVKGEVGSVAKPVNSNKLNMSGLTNIKTGTNTPNIITPVRSPTTQNQHKNYQN